MGLEGMGMVALRTLGWTQSQLLVLDTVGVPLQNNVK